MNKELTFTKAQMFSVDDLMSGFVTIVCAKVVRMQEIGDLLIKRMQ